MKTKTILLAATLSLAAFGAGCEDPCEQGLELRSDVTSYEATVTEMIGQPAKLERSCETFAGWQPKLSNHSNFSRRVAYNYFYTESNRCIAWGIERRCWAEYHHGRRYVRCQDYQVCRAYDRMPHWHDGFAQATELSDLLMRVKTDLSNSCTAFQNGKVAEAQDILGHAKIKFQASQQNADYVLTRAGCYNRKGN